MKYLPIVPTLFMNDIFLCSNATVVLAHLIEQDNEYRYACLQFKKNGGQLWLDNSFYERRKNYTSNEMAEKANLVDADVITLPDTKLHDNIKKEMKKYVYDLRMSGVKGKMMAVVFADDKNFDRDLELFRVFNDLDCVDIIAIPYVFRKGDDMKRPQFLNMIEKNVKQINKQCHLFGCNSFENLKKEKRGWISSVDGTLPWKLGYYNIRFPIKDIDDKSRPHNYFNINILNDEQRKDINFNLTYISEYLKK